MNGTTTTPKLFTLSIYFESSAATYYGIVAPIVSSIVIVTNFLLIFTLVKGKFRMSAHVMMIAMAVADTLTGLAPLPFNIYLFGFEIGADYLTLPWCYIHEYMLAVLPDIFHVCSLHLTVGLGIDRFVIFAFPLKARNVCTFRNGIILSIAIVIISICSQIDIFSQVTYESVSVKSMFSNETINGCLRSAKVRTDSEYVTRIVFLIFVPCFILIVFSVLLLFKSKKVQQWRKENASEGQIKSPSLNSLEKIDRAVILIMAFIVISEVTIWTLVLIRKFSRIRITDTQYKLNAISFILFQLTSLLNFSVLCVLSSKFRNVIRKSFCVCLLFEK